METLVRHLIFWQLICFGPTDSSSKFSLYTSHISASSDYKPKSWWNRTVLVHLSCILDSQSFTQTTLTNVDIFIICIPNCDKDMETCTQKYRPKCVPLKFFQIDCFDLTFVFFIYFTRVTYRQKSLLRFLPSISRLTYLTDLATVKLLVWIITRDCWAQVTLEITRNWIWKFDCFATEWSRSFSLTSVGVSTLPPRPFFRVVCGTSTIVYHDIDLLSFYKNRRPPRPTDHFRPPNGTSMMEN
jgi:hypothetical protein